MLFEDKSGNIMTPDEVDELSDWEVQELGIHALREKDIYLTA